MNSPIDVTHPVLIKLSVFRQIMRNGMSRKVVYHRQYPSRWQFAWIPECQRYRDGSGEWAAWYTVNRNFADQIAEKCKKCFRERYE